MKAQDDRGEVFTIVAKCSRSWQVGWVTGD
jgi:hypothetical protein